MKTRLKLSLYVIPYCQKIDFMEMVYMLTTTDDNKHDMFNELYVFPSIEQLLVSQQWDAIEQRIDKIFACASQLAKLQQEHLAEIDYVFIYSCLRFCHLHQISVHAIFDAYLTQKNNPSDVNSPAFLHKKWIAILQALRQESQHGHKKETISLVQKAQAYIRNNLDGDVTLQAISDYMFVHPTTLTRLFKTETGLSIGEYLLQLRMEKAVFLLEQKNMKVCDIARQLGYQSTSYFIQVFKQTYGLTPVQYKSSFLS